MSVGRVRELSEADLIALEALFESRKESHGLKLQREWYKLVDVPTVIARLRAGVVESRIVDGYLVCFSVGSPWYSNKLVISEEMVFNLYGGLNFDAVVDFLELEGEARGCSAVSVGTALATSSRALCRMYERRGFRRQSEELIKEL